MMEWKAFLMKPKHQCHLPQWGEWVYSAQSWKERRLLSESMFVLIDKRTLSLKMMERKVFLVKPKHQCHLSQWGKWVYGTQSWKEKRLLCEFVFIPIYQWILNLKLMEKEAFLMKPKHQCHLSLWGEWVSGA